MTSAPVKTTKKESHKKSLALDRLDDEGRFNRLSVNDNDVDDDGAGEALNFDRAEEAKGVEIPDVDTDEGLPDDLLGVGVYAALSALSVPILIPSLAVANLWAAGLMVATLVVKFPVADLGVFKCDRAFSMALFFLSR